MIRVGRLAAETEGVGRAAFVLGDWEDAEARSSVLRALPSPPAAVTCVSAFHYFRDPSAAARHVREALEPGGTFLLLDRAVDGSVGTAAWDLLHRLVVHDQVRFYRTQELASCLLGAGFENVEILARIRRRFWKGKLQSSLALLSARAPR
jgi:hypothetical protein